MLKGKAKRSLAFVLAACMLLALLPSFGAGASAASVSYTEVDPSVIDTGTAVLPEAEQDAEQDVPAADEEVHVIILFEQKSLAKKGFSTKDLLENEKAASYSSSLKKQQLSLVDRIEREALGGEELEIRYQFTVAVNGVATVVPYGRIEQILAVDGVADVYLEERYELDETVQPDTATAGEMVGSYSAWADGYTGAGSRIAIIDTGLDLSHPSFSEGGYYYSLGISAASFGKKISDYNLLTKEEIKKALPNLSISADKNPPKADDLYRNAKVPFAYNYVDDGLDVSHDAEGDSNGDHGTHVAGIAAANRYVPHYDADGDLYYDKQELGVTGVAPDAQLVVMKVFGVGGGAYSSDYMAAIEDAIWLNCDSVNLSLGSGSAGRSYGSKSDQQILDSFRNTDTVVTVSAGNNGAWGENVLTGTGMTYTTDVRMHTGGSPGSYTNSFTIASVTNTSMSGVMGKFNGVAAIPGDTGETYGAKNFSTLDTSEDQSGTTYDYVFLGDPVKGEGIYGLPENYANVDVKGKVVLVSRGNSSFADKANAAIQAGAAAAVIYNNAPGSINMNLTGYNFPNPAVMIEQSKAKEILAASTQDETTGLWGGKMTVSAKAETLHGVADGYKPSSFSSWGTTENLDLKPELMTPGGNIYSTLNHSSYGMMSGTSMAAPSAAGGAAIMAQYIKEHKLSKQEGLTVRALAMALMMSTSEPLTDPDTGVTYSPRQQGSGLMQLQEAVTSPAYLLVGEKEGNDGKVKLTFGDDAERTGVYTGSFSVQNLSDSPLHYALSGKVTTMAVEEVEGEDYMSDSAYALDANVTFSADGKSVYVYDLNGDDKVDEQDALVLLKAANGTHDALDAETVQKYDLDADGTITTADAQLYLAAVKGDKSVVDVYAVTYEVPANGSMNVSFTVRLTDGDKAWLNGHYPNGSYIEGFLYADSCDGDGRQLSVPMLGFYGSWAEPSMYDKSVYLEDMCTEGATGYVAQRTNFLVQRMAGSTSGYYFGGNLYAEDDEAIADRASFANESGNTIYAAVPTMIRNASDLKVTIRNAETGEVYKTVDYGTATGAYYSASSSAWSAAGTQVNLSWRGTAADNKTLLPEGTPIEVVARAVSEYYWDRETETVIGGEENLPESAFWTTRFVLDNTAPQANDIVLHSSAATGKRSLSVTVQDNRYVAAVLLLSRNGKQILARQAVNQTEPGTETTLEFPLDGIYTNDLLVAVYDYACNVTAYQTSFGGNVEQPAANATLRAAVPGTDDTTLFLELNTEDKSSIKALNENNPLPASVLSVTRGPEGKLLLASNELDDSKNLVSTLYAVDETDYSAVAIGKRSTAAYTSMTYLPSLNGGTLLAGYGYNLLRVDTATGTMTSLGSFASVIGRGVYIVGMTYVGPEETDEYGTCDDFAMLCSDGSVYLFSMAYYTNAYGRKTYGLYSRSLLGNVPDVMANYAAGSALYYADNRLYISVLTTSASKLSYVDLTADIFWPISIGQISAAPVALYSAMQNAVADDAAALAPWAERQTGMQALEPAAAETLTAQPLPALQ